MPSNATISKEPQRIGTVRKRPVARQFFAVALLCAFAQSCESKSFRDEAVFTRASSRAPVDAPPVVITTGGAGTGSPVVRSPLQATASASSQAPSPDLPEPSPSSPASSPEAGAGGAARNTEPSPSEPSPTPQPDDEPEPNSPVAVEPEPEPASTPSPAQEPAPEPEQVAPVEFSKRALLEGIAACTLEKLERFHGEAEVLRNAASAYEADASPDELLALQQAWLSAMLTWERAELFRFGPAAVPGEPGGRGLRDHIYAWNQNPPGSHRCRIEMALVERAYQSPDFGSVLVVVRTLSALEFLTFYSGTDTACTSFDSIVAEGTWAALDEAELVQRRAEYASAVAREVFVRAGTLLHAWSPDGDDFGSVFTSPGNGNDMFPNEQSVFNAVGSALFYIEKDVKDYKLGMPLGLVPECPKASCPEAFESQWARVSTLLLYENLNGFEELFSGCGPYPSSIGFDDWLVAVGASDLALRMQSALDHAQNVVATLDPPLEDALLLEPAKVSAVHAAVKGITDLLKTEFITVLNLELPNAVASDDD